MTETSLPTAPTTGPDTAAAAALPRLDLATAWTVLIAGALATVAFDLFGQTISPLLISVASPYLGAKLAPVPLAQAVLAKISGVPGKELAALGIPYGLHTLTGLIAYPLGWLLVVRPLQAQFAPQMPWWIAAATYGVALWAFALYGMAHLVAGNAPFLGWGSITWVALWGHVLFALVAAGVIEARLRR
ncbi:MAG: hypothetical protein AAGC57_11105 [Pseudomonadota bacterium]